MAALSLDLNIQTVMRIGCSLGVGEQQTFKEHFWAEVKGDKYNYLCFSEFYLFYNAVVQ